MTVVPEDSGTSQWRYRCPYCNSCRLRKRQKTVDTLASYDEIDEDDVRLMRRSKTDERDLLDEVAQFYCRHCQTPVEETERVDTANT